MEKGLADNTVSSYENDLVQFAIYLDQAGVSSWQSVDLDNVSSWLRTLTNENMPYPVYPESYLLFGCYQNFC